MVVISSVVSVISFSALGLLAELLVLSIARSLCFACNFIWFRQAPHFVCFLAYYVFACVSCPSLPLDARDAAYFAVFAVFPILVFGSLFSQCSSSSISCFSS